MVSWMCIPGSTITRSSKSRRLSISFEELMFIFQAALQVIYTAREGLRLS